MKKFYQGRILEERAGVQAGAQMYTSGDLRPFFEIERAHTAFEVFELDSAQIGSGRPGGPRSNLWGSIIVLARAALEEGMRRIHAQICFDPACDYSKVPMDPGQLEIFLVDHQVVPVATIPAGLHVSLRYKPDAKSGSGSGVLINGPRTSTDLFDLLSALNHIRNGFAHGDPKKTEVLPRHGSGILWVKPESGTLWTVQKPHAFSAMRFCESTFRFLVASCFGEDTALELRHPLPLLLDERLLNRDYEHPLILLGRTTDALKEGNLRTAYLASRRLSVALLSVHRRGSSPLQATLNVEQPPAGPSLHRLCDEIVVDPRSNLNPSHEPPMFD